VRPTGEWNTLTLRVEQDRVQATVNGIAVLDTPVSDPNIGPAGYVCLDGRIRRNRLSQSAGLRVAIPRRGEEVAWRIHVRNVRFAPRLGDKSSGECGHFFVVNFVVVAFSITMDSNDGQAGNLPRHWYGYSQVPRQ